MSAGNVKDAHADLTSPLLGLDWSRPSIITAWGTKGSGKSVLNRLVFRSWDLDALCVDVNGNADPGPHAEKLDGADLPKSWPERLTMPGEPSRPRVLHYRAHPAEPSYRLKLDQAVRLALYPQRKRTLLWAGEIDEFHQGGQPVPHLKLALRQNRHYNLTCLFDGPRPVFVHPLCLAQSDLVAVFHLPNPRDRERIADSIGFPPKLFHEAAHRCWRTEHAFLLWDSRAKRLYEHEPLPLGDEAAA